MVIIDSNNLPIHSECMISYPYGEVDAGYSCGWHTGVDFVPHGSTENYPLVYPIFESEVIEVHLDSNNALGIYVLLYDGSYYWRYCHLMENSVSVSVGDIITPLVSIARMDTTGTHLTGTHLHLECSTTSTWQCETFVNPCNIMNIPNVDDQVFDWIPAPVPTVKKNKFKWVLYTNKLRLKRR